MHFWAKTKIVFVQNFDENAYTKMVQKWIFEQNYDEMRQNDDENSYTKIVRKLIFVQKRRQNNTNNDEIGLRKRWKNVFLCKNFK